MYTIAGFKIYLLLLLTIKSIYSFSDISSSRISRSASSWRRTCSGAAWTSSAWTSCSTTTCPRIPTPTYTGWPEQAASVQRWEESLPLPSVFLILMRQSKVAYSVPGKNRRFSVCKKSAICCLQTWAAALCGYSSQSTEFKHDAKIFDHTSQGLTIFCTGTVFATLAFVLLTLLIDSAPVAINLMSKVNFLPDFARQLSNPEQ